MAKNTGPCVQPTDSYGRNDPLPDLTIQQIPTAKLKAAKHPIRKLSNRQISKVKASIEENGFVVPVILGKDLEILDGHSRLEAARRLGLQTVPCIEIEHLDVPAQRALRVALNKIQETGEWDEQALKIELAYQLEFGADLTVLGFEPPELDSLLEISPAPGDEHDPIDDIATLPEPSSSAVSQLGDTWKLGNHLVYCGNARDVEVMRLPFAGHGVDLVFTDPPFNVRVNGHIRTGSSHFEEFAEASGEMSHEEFTAFLASYLSIAKTLTEPGALIYSFMDWRHMDEMLSALAVAGLELINLCVWVKPNGGMGSFYRSRHELVFVARHPGASHMNNVALGSHGRYRTNVWEYAGATGGVSDDADDFSLHPTVV